MGNSLYGGGPPVVDPCVCIARQAPAHFPLQVSIEVARATSAAVLGSTIETEVVGYTTSTTRAAGGESLRVKLSHSGRGTKHAESSNCSVLAVSLRAPDRIAFLPGFAAPLVVDGKTEGYEIIVLARPDKRFREVTQLEEDLLQALYPSGSRVDLRILRRLRPFEPGGSAEWLKKHLLSLGVLLETHFGPHAAGTGVGGCECPKADAAAGENIEYPRRANFECNGVDRDAVEHWLLEAGIETIVEEDDAT
eukprot:TRINITY_DN35436_c0_g1_i1.p1 TRINITY_DN35436_c0_g1~~TRINITY_DN35436_c0_g1_i1.p1  ORF type:complete len:250 (-),score=46.43 TRINITY_DN35436_c0_g1_i1:34-783(-)